MRRPILLSLPLVVGCGPGDRPRVETEHLDFHGELEGACEGLGVLYEREVDRIGHELGRGLLEPVEVHVGLGEVEHRCPEGTSTQRPGLTGCVVSPTEIATTLDSLSFQLVDATRLQHGAQGVPFIEGALPYMVGYARPIQSFVQSAAPERQGGGVIDSQLDHGWTNEHLVDDGLAIHFLHWVEQTYGSQALRAWLWSDAVLEGVDVGPAFAEAMGEPVALAEERWNEEAERDAMFGGLCHGLPAPSLDEGLRVEASACCDAPGVEQFEPPLVNAGQQCFTVDGDTEVEVELFAGEGDLVLRADGCPHWPDASPLVVRAGEVATVTLTACRWKAMVIGPERCGEHEGVRYAIRPSS